MNLSKRKTITELKKEYLKLRTAISQAEELMSKLKAQSSEVCKQLFETAGPGPYDINGRALTIMKREGSDPGPTPEAARVPNGKVVYFFRGPKVVDNLL